MKKIIIVSIVCVIVLCLIGSIFVIASGSKDARIKGKLKHEYKQSKFNYTEVENHDGLCKFNFVVDDKVDKLSFFCDSMTTEEIIAKRDEIGLYNIEAKYMEKDVPTNTTPKEKLKIGNNEEINVIEG